MADRSLQFVMFHAFQRSDALAESMIRMAGASIHNHYPGAEIVLVTNVSGEVIRRPAWLTVRHSAVDLDRLMFERIRLYREHLGRPDVARHVVFLDTDMLVIRRFDVLFDDAADITVTIRRWNKEAPINGGLYVVNTMRREAVVGFFQRFVDCYSRQSAELLGWDGDQMVIADLLAGPGFPSRLPAVAERADLRVRFVAVDEFNNTPSSLLLRLALFNPLARILHFKGGRKHRMGLYSRLYGSNGLGRLARRSAR